MRPRLVVDEAWTSFVADAARWVRPGEAPYQGPISAKRLVALLVQRPPLRAMAWFRVAVAMHQLGVRGVPSWTQRRLLRLYGLEMSPSVPTGAGLYIAHPVGCVLMAEEIGANVSVIAQVTFGMRTEARWPRIGDSVTIGAGARVLGGITLGTGCVVGANAVVVDDVAPGVTVVGAPARPTSAHESTELR